MKVFPKVSFPLLVNKNSHSITTGLLLFFSRCVLCCHGKRSLNSLVQLRRSLQSEWLIDWVLCHMTGGKYPSYISSLYTLKRMSHCLQRVTDDKWTFPRIQCWLQCKKTIQSYSETQAHLSSSCCIFLHSKSCIWEKTKYVQLTPGRSTVIIW